MSVCLSDRLSVGLAVCYVSLCRQCRRVMSLFVQIVALPSQHISLELVSIRHHTTDLLGTEEGCGRKG